jgi:hypothetical protein
MGKKRDATMDRELRLNGSGIPDPTASKAIQKVDKSKAIRYNQPKDLDELITAIKTISRLAGYDIEGRIIFRNRKTNELFK